MIASSAHADRQNPAYRPSAFFPPGVQIILPKHTGIIAVSIWILAVFAALCPAEQADSTVVMPIARAAATPGRIAHIFINGNKITKPYVIMAYCDFDTGMQYDSLAVKTSERRLKATRLFLDVKLLSLRKEYGYDIYILVSEYPLYLTFPPMFDINHYFWHHGDRGSWYCPAAGMQLTNLGGRAEELGIAAQVGEWQEYDAYWTKPLFPSKYYIGIGAAYNLLPDPSWNQDLEEVSGSLTFGRRFFERSKGYCSVSPDFRRVTDSVGGFADFRQVYGTLGWVSDLRSSAFDPSSGAWFRLEACTNYLFHDETVKPYVQYISDFKWYIPFLFRDAKFAFRLFSLLRTHDASDLDRVLIGGINSVRGYYTEEIGLDIIANDACIFNVEYRFPLYKFPSISEVMPENYTKMLGRFSEWSPRLDGALIGDWGRVSATQQALFGSGSAPSRTGSGIGFGLRITEPTLKLTACADFIWSESLIPGTIKYEPRRLLHLYSGINF